MNSKLLSLSLILLCATLAADPSSEVRTTRSVETAGGALLSKQLLKVLGGAQAKKSIRGTRALWVDLIVQKPVTGTAADSLEADLRLTDMEGQLRDAGFKIMDPKKRSLALGLRPTLQLNVLYEPAGGDSPKAFYLVTAHASQDVTPLGGDTCTMITWLNCSPPIPSSNDLHVDADPIRSSARACVRAFIEAAKDSDEAP